MEQQSKSVPDVQRKAGWVLTGIAGLFLVMDGLMKLVRPQPVVDTMASLGWPTDRPTIVVLGVILLSSTALYLFHRTSFLGAVLLTGYLGGAVATHMRIYSPLFTHVMFGVYLGGITWGGLWLRDPSLRRLLPLRQ